MGFSAAVPDSALPPGASQAAYAMRVFFNGAWLDTQNAIETQLVECRVTTSGGW